MKKLLLAVATATMLSACGHAGPAVQVAPVASAQMDAQATQTLLKGFRDVYMAVFTKLDANEDGVLDEYEASAAIDMRDVAKADRNHDGHLTKTEFINYADGGNGVFGFMHQTRDSFLKQARDAMGRAFQRLDKNGDRQLEESELSDDALKKVNMYLRIDALHVNVHITTLDDDIVSAADHTGDNKLSQAEWEDYCINSFIKMINPNYKPGSGQDPAPADDPNADDDNNN